MSTVDEFQFLVSDPKQTSKRERELQSAQARAHAAQVSHARRRVRSPLTLNRWQVNKAVAFIADKDELKLYGRHRAINREGIVCAAQGVTMVRTTMHRETVDHPEYHLSIMLIL